METKTLINPDTFVSDKRRELLGEEFVGWYGGQGRTILRQLRSAPDAEKPAAAEMLATKVEEAFNARIAVIETERAAAQTVAKAKFEAIKAIGPVSREEGDGIYKVANALRDEKAEVEARLKAFKAELARLIAAEPGIVERHNKKVAAAA